MVDINEVAKKLTREEFLLYVIMKEMCPWEYDLTDIREATCDEGKIVCDDCWNQAILNMKFKGEKKIK